VLHCFLLPGAIIVFMGVHFWRIRKDGGISGPPLPLPEDTTVAELAENGPVSGSPAKTYGLMSLAKGGAPHIHKQPEDTVDTYPHLLYRELIMIVAATAVLLGTSYFFMAPLEEPANPNLVPYIAKAPWYFLGIQEMISWSPLWPLGHLGITAMFLYGVVLPTLMIVILAIVPYIDRDPGTAGVWFHPARKRAITLFTLWVIVMGVLILIGEYCRGHGWAWHWPWAG
jgi:quinol-cytochrome oxidoreductase complex cytochrome b subunit